MVGFEGREALPKLKLTTKSCQDCDSVTLRLETARSKSSLLRRFSVMLLLSSNFGRMTAMYPSVNGCSNITDKGHFKCYCIYNVYGYLHKFLLLTVHTMSIYVIKMWTTTLQCKNIFIYLLQQEGRCF